jgi:hypothetical protein
LGAEKIDFLNTKGTSKNKKTPSAVGASKI